MKGISIHVEDELYRRLKIVLFHREERLCEHMRDLIERDVEECEKALAMERAQMPAPQ